MRFGYYARDKGSSGSLHLVHESDEFGVFDPGWEPDPTKEYWVGSAGVSPAGIVRGATMIYPQPQRVGLTRVTPCPTCGRP